MTTTEKTCFKCKVTQPVENFYRHPMMGDGRLGKCKACTKLDVAENRLRRMEYYKAFEAERAKLPHRVRMRQIYARSPNGVAAHRRALARQVKKFPEKYSARTQFGNAVRDGRIARPPACWHCGAQGKIHGHHSDYSMPLAVTWLCTKCHAETHQLTKALLRGKSP